MSQGGYIPANTTVVDLDLKDELSAYDQLPRELRDLLKDVPEVKFAIRQTAHNVYQRIIAETWVKT